MNRRRNAKIVAVVAAIVVGVIVYSCFDPSSARFFPRCPFLMLTGYKCPGCGTQRAIHAMLHGDFLAALNFNAAMVASLPLLIIYGYAEAMRKRKPSFYVRVNSPAIIMTIFVLVVLWWVLRNVFGW